MVFVTKPTKEGQTTKCPNCDTDIIVRWTDYGGKYPDKLQWQTVEPRKAHYTKDGSCKEESSEQDNGQSTLSPESSKDPTTVMALLEAILHTLNDIKRILEPKDGSS